MKLICFALIVMSFSLMSVQAQTGEPVHGTDSMSGLSYVERSSPDWTYTGMDLRPDGLAIAIGTMTGAIELFDNRFEPLGTLLGHTDDVLTLDWNGDGSQLASGSRDTDVHIWDIATGSLRLTLSHDYEIYEVAWSSDGSKLATLGGVISAYDSEGGIYTDDRLNVWDISNGGVLIWSVDFHNSSASMAWSPDGTMIAVGGHEHPLGSSVLIWDANTGDLLKDFPSAWSPIIHVVWSPDGSKIAYGVIRNEAAVYIIDPVNGHYLAQVYTADTVTALAWNPSGTKLAFAALSSTMIGVFDIPTANELYLWGHQTIFQHLKWSERGNSLASQSVDGTVRIWNMSELRDLSGTPTVTPRPTLKPTPQPI